MLTPEAITTVAAYALGLAAGAGGLAVVVRYGATPQDPDQPGRHRAADPEPVLSEEAWARLADALPPAEAAHDAALTPTDDRLRVGPAASSAETLPMPAAGPPASVAAAVVLEYRGGAA